jgi:hypothetical protein
VSDSSPLLDRAGIEEAFRRLGDRLARRGVVADLYVFGGAAMALAYDSRRATRDVDALFTPHGIVLEEALAVAAELGLPPWWLNEQASSYVAPGGDSAASRVFDHPGLRVFAASAEHLRKKNHQPGSGSSWRTSFPNKRISRLLRCCLPDLAGQAVSLSFARWSATTSAYMLAELGEQPMVYRLARIVLYCATCGCSASYL